MEIKKINEIRNPILKEFLSNEAHLELYQQYFLTPNEITRKKIEECFVNFYAQIRVISYFSKTIHFAARRYDKKRRIYDNRNLLYLDCSSNNTNDALLHRSAPLKELVEDENATRTFENYFDKSIEELIHNQIVHNSILTLNERQKKILYLAYVMNLSDKEISKKFNVTQQAISKSKNNALKKVRQLLNAGSK